MVEKGEVDREESDFSVKEEEESCGGKRWSG